MLTPGTRLGPYDIKSLIGQGGMGEVYRARDTRLDRDVAVKILPAGFASDPERLARFEREAKTLAALNHPNIAHIHGVEDDGVTRAIVMELVEGEDLAQRLARGPIMLATSLVIAGQVADALQAAHDHGIVHRDLKPANVKVKADGTVKLLDFGLAKAAANSPASALSHSPTMVESMPGTLLGTAPYMSPEQVKGEPADARADVWAFGCLLYELLTGRRAFAANTTSETLAAVLTAEPDWERLAPDTPEPLRRLLRRCLQKNDTHRLRALADARLDIEDAQQPVPQESRPRSAPSRRIERIAWGSALAFLGIVTLTLDTGSGSLPPTAREVRFDINTPDVANPFLLTCAAISPDGRQVLFVADADGQPHVWLRDIDSVVARPLPGSGGAAYPFWSPDGRSLAFFADGLLKRLDLDGGLVRTLAKATVGVGGTWSPRGVILFVRNPASAIYRVPADGGSAVETTRLEAGQVGHAFPHFLPDGQHFLYYVTAGPDARGIHIGQLDGSASRRLVDADGGGVYTNGHLLFVRQSSVLAQPFDADRLALSGTAFQIADGIYGLAGGQSLTLSASPAGFVFRAGTTRFVRQFTWVDRSGNPIENVGDPLPNPDGISASPDRRQLVYFERGAISSDLWILDLRRGFVSRFTEETDEDIFPLWSRDGSRIIYSVVQNGQLSIYQKPVGTGPRELLIPPQRDELMVSDVSPDSRHLLYQRMNANTGWDVWALPVGGGEAVPIVQTEADERGARLSPDGRWIAFVANNSGVSEVFVQRFPGPGPRSQVSIKGGDEPQWRADGSELFYLAPDGRVTATSVKPAADHASIEVGPPVALFFAPVGGTRPVLAADYISSPDGQRFLLNRLVRDAGTTPLRVVLNWHPAR